MKTYIKYILGLIVSTTLFAACSDSESEVATLRISTLVTKDVYWDQATVKGKIDYGQQKDIAEMGFYCDTLSNLIDNAKAMHLVCEGEEFVATFDNLKKEKQYYVQAYAKTTDGEIVYGNMAMFATTKVYSLTIENDNPAYANITGRGATLWGIVVEDNNIHIGYVGAKYWKASQNENSALEVEVSLHPENAPSNGDIFSIVLEDLEPNTAYKAYVGARNSRGMIYGELIEFSTVDIVLAEATTGVVDAVSFNSISIKDNLVVNDGFDPQTVYGLYVYALTNDGETPLDSWIKIEGIPDENGKYSSSYDQLDMNTDYIARAYATNHAGTALGTKVPFKTLNQEKPTVETTSYLYKDYFKPAESGDINFGIDYLHMRGIVTSTGGVDLTTSGFEWGTSPSALNNQVTAQMNASDKTLIAKISGLTTSGAKIYYRAWAENIIGKEFGDIVSVTVPLKTQAWKKDSDGKTTIQNSAVSLYYYELDAIDVTGNERYIFLDRNLGATERVTNVYGTLYPSSGTSFVSGMFNTVGDYYKFGANTPILTVDVNPANSNTNWNDVVDTSVAQDGLDGSGNWTQSQPCPAGYVMPTADQWIKISDKYNSLSTNLAGKFDAIKNDLNIQGTSFLRIQGGNYTLPNNYNQYSTYLPASTKNTSNLGQYLIVEYATASNTMLGISMNNFSNANTQTAGLPVRCMRIETVTP